MSSVNKSNPLPNTLRRKGVLSLFTFFLLSDLRVWTLPVTATDGGGLIMIMMRMMTVH